MRSSVLLGPPAIALVGWRKPPGLAEQLFNLLAAHFALIETIL
jgi:hypothetical protein